MTKTVAAREIIALGDVAREYQAAGIELPDLTFDGLAVAIRHWDAIKRRSYDRTKNVLLRDLAKALLES